MLKMKQVSKQVDELFEEFLNSKRAQGIKQKTLKTYKEHYNSISRTICSMPMEQVNRKDIEKIVLELKDRNLHPNSIKSYMATLSSFFSWGREQGYTSLIVKKYKGEETVKDTYTDQELKKLLAKPNLKNCSFCEYRNWVIINLLLNSGCRASTIRNILIKDVDLNSGMITYRHTKTKQVQVVPLCQEMRKILKDYMRVRQGNENQYLFPSEDDIMMTQNCLAQAIRKYNRSRGVSKTSIHLFRHSFAQRYIKNGGSPFDLQRILGHTTLTMTKHYCRIYDTEIVKNYDKLSPLSSLFEKNKKL